MHSEFYGDFYVMRVSVRLRGRKGTFNWEFTASIVQVFESLLSTVPR